MTSSDLKALAEPSGDRLDQITDALQSGDEPTARCIMELRNHAQALRDQEQQRLMRKARDSAMRAVFMTYLARLARRSPELQREAAEVIKAADQAFLKVRPEDLVKVKLA